MLYLMGKGWFVDSTRCLSNGLSHFSVYRGQQGSSRQLFGVNIQYLTYRLFDTGFTLTSLVRKSKKPYLCERALEDGQHIPLLLLGLKVVVLNLKLPFFLTDSIEMFVLYCSWFLSESSVFT